MKKVITHILRILGWMILGIIILLVLVSLLIQTRPVKNKLADVAENQSSKFIHGELAVGKIDGNFFTEIILEDFLVSYKYDTLAYIEKIDASYNLWKLLWGEIDILQVRIEQPYFNIEQYTDSTWSVQKLVKESASPADTSQKTGSVNLSVAQFEIIGADFEIIVIDSLIPNRINNLTTELSFLWSDQEQHLNLKHFSFSTQKPDFQLNEFTINAKRDSGSIHISDLYLKTAKNSIDARAMYRENPFKKGEAQVKTTEIQLNEFEFIIPDFKLAAHPVVKFDGNLTRDSAYFQVELKDNNQGIAINGTSANLIDFLTNKTKAPLEYNLDLLLENTELDYWLGNPELDYMLNGIIQLNGKGTDLKTGQFHLNGDFSRTVVKGEELREILLEIKANNGNANAIVSGQGKFGNFGISSKINNVLGAAPDYVAKVNAKNLDLALLTGIDSLYSNLNLTANLKGKGFDPEKLSASATVEILNSRFQTVNFDSLLLSAMYRKENISANYLRLVTDSVLVTVNGNYSFHNYSDLQAEIAFEGLGDFQQFIPVTGLTSSGKLIANYTSDSDSVFLNATANLNESTFQDLRLQNMKLDARAQWNKTDTLLNTDIQINNFTAGSFLIDSLVANISGKPDSLFITANVKNKDLNTKLKTAFNPGEKLSFTLYDWLVDYKNQSWALQNPPAKIEIDPANYAIKNFVLASTQTAIQQSISADGEISRKSEEDFELKIENIDLSRLPEMYDLDFTAKGLFNLNLKIGGTADSTVVNGNYSFKNLSYNSYRFLNFDGSLNYRENEVKIETTIAPKDSGIFNLQASLPVSFRLDSMNYNIDEAEKLNIGLTIDKFPLSILKPLQVNENIEGNAVGSIHIIGTPESPLIKGELELMNASVNEYKFTDFRTDFDFGNDLFNVDALINPKDEGSLNINAALPVQINLDTMGYLLPPDVFLDGEVSIEKLSLSLLKAFNISQDIIGSLNGRIHLGGTWENPDPKGNIRLSNGSAKINEYGINYQNIKLNLQFLKDILMLDTLFIASEDGILQGNGKIEFNSALYEGDIKNSEIQLDFNRFNLLNHRQFNMQVTGNASLKGDKERIVYGGDLKIPQSEIYLPAVLSMAGRMQTPEMPKPILIRHAEKMQISLDSLGIKTFEIAQPDSVNFDYFENLEGKLRLRIPKNTWIKNEDLRMELSGELELIKSNEFFELFGSVEVVRGQYDLLGKTFVIEEGIVNFQGGEEMLPNLNLTASYSFRNAQRVQQELTVQITGTAESPKVDFQLDGTSISEGDALSYILFGKGMNELTMNEQENVEGAGGGSLAEKAAASVLSSQLTNFLSDKLNVDYIEVKSDGGFNNASVVVGKYITNDLFVSYEQRFGETDEMDVAKYEVKAEYELFRFLFFELNNSSTDSGFDIIFKFDVK